jgi:hypothetical protein
MLIVTSVPVGLLTAVLLCFTLPSTLWNEPAAQRQHPVLSSLSLRRLDFLGATLMLGTLVLLATGLQQASLGYGWSSAQVLALLICSAPFVVAFFTWQWYATQRRTNPEPVFPWRFCQSRIQLGRIMYVDPPLCLLRPSLTKRLETHSSPAQSCSYASPRFLSASLL